MKKPELLAPAGNMESLKAAIQGGCDAVYLGGTSFGARSFAGNFTNEEIIEAITYAHLYGVKVYVTVNTLVYDEEVQDFLNYIDFLHKNNVDAVIIQDLGMFDLVRKTYPNLELHASTQMHIHNLEGAKFAEQFGFKRIVLARETTIENLSEIKRNTNLEIEVFVHGALCVSYSGQCLMSAMQSNRSGNRGSCMQPCRMRYSLISDDKKVNHDDYLLSPKDLNTVFNIGRLIDMGIDSFKIEGRMKRPEYVYLITRLYRKAIDNFLECRDTKITEYDIKEIKKIFNRDFTKGFLFHEDNDSFTNEFRPNHLGIEIGKVIATGKGKVKIKLSDYVNQGDGIRIISNNDVGKTLNKIYKDGLLVNSAKENEIIEIEIDDKVNIGDKVLKTTDIVQLDRINRNIKEAYRKVLVNVDLKLFGKTATLTLDDTKNKVVVAMDIVEKAINRETVIGEIIDQIKKFGDSVYEVNRLDVQKDSGIFVRVSDLNNLRRTAIQKLNEKRLYQTEYKKEEYKINLKEIKEEPGFSILTNELPKEKYKYIYTTNKSVKGHNVIYKLPRVIEGNVPKGDLLCGEIGSLWKNKSYSDFSLNIVNSYAVAFLHSMGVKRITLSYELSYEQTKNLVDSYIKRYNQKPNLEVIISSYPEVMISKYNLFKKYNITNGYLKDINGNKYKIETMDDFMVIYGSNKIELDPDKYFAIGINTLRVIK